MKVLGTIEKIGSKNQYTEKFAKAELILVTEDKYPQTLCVQFVNDNISKLAQYAVGDLVEVSINIRGREWTSPQGEVKYFTTLEGWTLGLAGDGRQAPMSPSDLHTKTEEEDDLPF